MATIVTLIRLDTALRAAGVPIVGVSQLTDTTARIDYAPGATPAQQTSGASILAAFDWSAAADVTFFAKQEKSKATTSIDVGALATGTATDRIVRALALVVLDEVNVLRAAVTPVLAARTAAQLVAAIKAKIAATGE